MKKLMIAATFASLLLGNAVAMAEDAAPPAKAEGMRPHHGKMLEMMDTDKDGVLTRAEHEAFTAARFKEMDADGDGKVTQEEMQKHRKERMGKGGHHCEGMKDQPTKE